MRVLDRIRAIAERVAMSEGLEIVDVELHGRGRGAVVRVFLDRLDRPNGSSTEEFRGVTHGDCQRVSGQIGTILDVEDVMPDRYTLEVSSPGLDRRLSKVRDFERFAGQQVKMLLRGGGSLPKNVRGRLLGMEDGRVRVAVEGGEVVALSTEEIERANLVPDFGGKFTPRPKRNVK